MSIPALEKKPPALLGSNKDRDDAKVLSLVHVEWNPSLLHFEHIYVIIILPRTLKHVLLW